MVPGKVAVVCCQARRPFKYGCITLGAALFGKRQQLRQQDDWSVREGPPKKDPAQAHLARRLRALMHPSRPPARVLQTVGAGLAPSIPAPQLARGALARFA